MLDTKPDPRNPVLKHTIEASELAAKAGYSRPHTVHCGPGGIFMSALGGPNGDDGPGGVALIDHDTFEVLGPWEKDRGPQHLAYDVWWHLQHDTVMTSEWGTPSMIENGLNPDDLLGRKFGHHLNFWSMSERTLTQRVDLGDEHQMVLELRPAHDPSKTYGFAGVVISVEDLSASIWLWHRDGDRWSVDKVITIPAEPADADALPPLLKPFGAVAPLVTDIDLSVDDRWLYVSCFGTGELKQYDVSDPFHPRETASVRLGGIVRREPHPAFPGQPLGGGPQMVEISSDGRRVYVTNSLYAAWDEVFYPDGVGSWMAKLDADVSGGGLSPTSRSSRTATSSADCGFIRPGCRAVTRPATRTASPTERHWRPTRTTSSSAGTLWPSAQRTSTVASAPQPECASRNGERVGRWRRPHSNIAQITGMKSTPACVSTYSSRTRWPGSR